MTTVKLTKRVIEAAKPDTKEALLWDSELKGFFCKITPSGKRSYFLYYRTKDGQQRKPKLGEHGAVTCEQAREMALKMLAAVSAGNDPSREQQDKRKAPTLAEFAARYVEQHAKNKKKPRSVEEDEGNLARHILPVLGSMKLASITRKHITDLHHTMREKPTTANRVIALLSKMFNLAEAWGLRTDGSNPCRHVQKYKENKRTRYLSEAELARLGAVLAEDAANGIHNAAANAIRLLILTGCRHSEVLTLTWQEVDTERHCLRLKDSKTGAKTIPLNPPALALLASLAVVDGNPHVFPGRFAESHLTNLDRYWGSVKKRAGLEDVRLHDLRHTYASVGAAGGFSLPVIGALLGHTQASTTQRYAHLADNPLKHATDVIGARIAAAMAGNKATVVDFKEYRAS